MKSGRRLGGLICIWEMTIKIAREKGERKKLSLFFIFLKLFLKYFRYIDVKYILHSI